MSDKFVNATTAAETAVDFSKLTEDEWRQRLSPEEYQVLRQAGTERPHIGEYTNTTAEGVYRCRACNAELFRSTEKFASDCGWPSFFSPLAGDNIIEREDRSLGMVRTEVLCANCNSHLGHVFAGEGYDTPTDLRYCINSISMNFEGADSEKKVTIKGKREQPIQKTNIQNTAGTKNMRENQVSVPCIPSFFILIRCSLLHNGRRKVSPNAQAMCNDCLLQPAESLRNETVCLSEGIREKLYQLH